MHKKTAYFPHLSVSCFSDMKKQTRSMSALYYALWYTVFCTIRIYDTNIRISLFLNRINILLMTYQKICSSPISISLPYIWYLPYIQYLPYIGFCLISHVYPRTSLISNVLPPLLRMTVILHQMLFISLSVIPSSIFIIFFISFHQIHLLQFHNTTIQLCQSAVIRKMEFHTIST